MKARAPEFTRDTRVLGTAIDKGGTEAGKEPDSRPGTVGGSFLTCLSTPGLVSGDETPFPA